ncbi:MAG TPA: sigma 54-interacting transcriptional regulator [Polyangiales bacterium]|nr:sigma 54-interacting transcriptional regulator [Polyangiales bacterium]
MTSVTLAHSGSGYPGRVLEIARCALLSLNGPRRGEEVIIDRECFRIGKSPDNDLVLADETVSREHCEIVRDDKGYLLRDLGSTNGTLLDGAEIREGYLRAGVVIRVGRVELKVRPFAERIDLLPSERESFGELVGRHPAMREVFGLLERLGPTDATLLVGGETGTGKDLLARAAHASSPRARHPFIVVDCGAVVGALIESELFGHEKGAFTGAVDSRKGAFELAHKGTLFLDEIGELPLELQPKLLRALESRRIRRVGGEREIPVDIRVIAATHRNLRLEVERGKFREDLYFRLAVVPLHLPPLRERRDDIPLIAEQLLSRVSTEGGDAFRIGQEAISALRAHDWPGNVRELRNVLERAALMTRATGETEVRMLGLPMIVQRTAAPAPADASEFDPARSYRETREQWENEFERRYVSWLLARHSGNVSSAAREADMDRKHLHKLAKKHGLRGE